MWCSNNFTRKSLKFVLLHINNEQLCCAKEKNIKLVALSTYCVLLNAHVFQILRICEIKISFNIVCCKWSKNTQFFANPALEHSTKFAKLCLQISVLNPLKYSILQKIQEKNMALWNRLLDENWLLCFNFK